jgi:hypothetical protein
MRTHPTRSTVDARLVSWLDQSCRRTLTPENLGIDVPEKPKQPEVLQTVSSRPAGYTRLQNSTAARAPNRPRKRFSIGRDQKIGLD